MRHAWLVMPGWVGMLHARCCAEDELVHTRRTKILELVDAAADALVDQYRKPVDACVERLRAILDACDGVEPMVEMEPIDLDGLDKLLHFAVSGAPPMLDELAAATVAFSEAAKKIQANFDPLGSDVLSSANTAKVAMLRMVGIAAVTNLLRSTAPDAGKAAAVTRALAKQAVTLPAALAGRLAELAASA